MNLSHYLEKFGEPATKIEIQNFEEKYRISMPTQIKDILYFSNGCATINRFIERDGLTVEYLTGFFSIEEIDYAIQNMKRIEEEYHYYFSDVLLPIGDPGGARYLCIGIGKEYKDNIYIIHYQDYDYENLDSMLTFVSSSIEDLLLKLIPEHPE